jgi:hypothetical protein
VRIQGIFKSLGEFIYKIICYMHGTYRRTTHDGGLKKSTTLLKLVPIGFHLSTILPLLSPILCLINATEHSCHSSSK